MREFIVREVEEASTIAHGLMYRPIHKDDVESIQSGTGFGDIRVEYWTDEEEGVSGVTLHQKGNFPLPDAISFHNDRIPELIKVLEARYRGEDS